MDTIIVGFSRPKVWKPFAALIMFGYGIPYDHVYVRWHSDKLERDIIYQASGTMVNFMGQQFFDNNIIVDEFTLPITPASKKAMIQFAMDNAGKPYGAKQCLGLTLVRIAQLVGKKIKNPFSDGGATYVCSELGSYILGEFAGDIIPEDQDDVTPLELYNYLQSIKAKQTIGE